MRIPSQTKSNGISIRNYGDQHFFPPKRLQDGLEEVVVFNENTSKRDIPNGSVWQYRENTRYNPELLKDDVGCGISRYDVEGDFPTKESASRSELLEYVDELWGAVNDEDITIGRGNHFIDFTSYNSYRHPDKTTSVFVHSDMNPMGETPQTYDQAVQRIRDASEARDEVADTLLDRLGLDYEKTGDWPHNTVDRTESGLLYRKGAITLESGEDADGASEGILGMTPSRGLFRYAISTDLDSWEKLKYSMQHGVGKIQSQNMFYKEWPNRRENKKEVYFVSEPNRKLEDSYQSISEFTDTFGSEMTGLGVYRPEFIVKTG
jgi:hypothetical protein